LAEKGQGRENENTVRVSNVLNKGIAVWWGSCHFRMGAVLTEGFVLFWKEE
jgi:hypothetical protein